MHTHVESASARPAPGLRRRATYQDVLDAPEDKIAELIDGELIVSPRPAKRRARVSSRLGSLLGTPFDLGIGGPGGWVIIDEPELHLEDDILVPDIAGWVKERAERLDQGAFFTVAPDWVCEILSPGTEARDRTDKLRIYARAGVKHAWLLDPGPRTFEVLGLGERGWARIKIWRGAAKIRAVPFDAVELDLALLWPAA